MSFKAAFVALIVLATIARIAQSFMVLPNEVSVASIVAWAAIYTSGFLIGASTDDR